MKRILIEDGLATILTICFMPFSVFRQCRDPDYAAWPLNAADRAGAASQCEAARNQIVPEWHLAPGRTQESAGGGNPALAILGNLGRSGCFRAVLK